MTTEQLAAKLVKGLKTKHQVIEREGAESWLVEGSSGKTVAQVLLRKSGLIRLNFSKPVPGMPEGILHESKRGGEKRWTGGAVIVTEDNLAQARELLEEAVS